MKANGPVKVRIYSFSYPRGMPADEEGHGGGVVFDCRGLPNPFWEEGLRGYSGKDEPVRAFFARHCEEVEAFAGAEEALVWQTIQTDLGDGRRHLMVAFGSTGGQHRSVFMAEELARRLAGIPGVEYERGSSGGGLVEEGRFRQSITLGCRHLPPMLAVMER